MNTVTLTGITVTQALEFKNHLVAQGLNCVSTDRDFEWNWTPPRWDSMTGNEPSQVTFEFQDPALATFYQLKFSQDGA
jgi:hypothetical protein